MENTLVFVWFVELLTINDITAWEVEAPLGSHVAPYAQLPSFSNPTNSALCRALSV